MEAFIQSNRLLIKSAKNEIKIGRIAMLDGELSKVIEQKYRAYMNCCTLDYSMCRWFSERIQ